MAIQVLPISAFKDNYIWLILNADTRLGCIVDPGDAKPVLTTLKELNIKLESILITHHHQDHVGGVKELLSHYNVPVYGPMHEADCVTKRLHDNEQFNLANIGGFKVIEIPGHTLGHIAYYGDRMLFCGDTLFTAGCGRLFEGTAEQMYQSLNKLAALPEDTNIYCGHEYTLANLKFAQAVEPNNNDIAERIIRVAELRHENLPTVPALLKAEKLTNPFLRCEVSDVIAMAEKHAGKNLLTPVEVFACLRDWKNNFS